MVLLTRTLVQADKEGNGNSALVSQTALKSSRVHLKMTLLTLQSSEDDVLLDAVLLPLVPLLSSAQLPGAENAPRVLLCSQLQLLSGRFRNILGSGTGAVGLQKMGVI